MNPTNFIENPSKITLKSPITTICDNLSLFSYIPGLSILPFLYQQPFTFSSTLIFIRYPPLKEQIERENKEISYSQHYSLCSLSQGAHEVVRRINNDNKLYWATHFLNKLKGNSTTKRQIEFNFFFFFTQKLCFCATLQSFMRKSKGISESVRKS